MHKTAPETAADMQQAEIPREPSQCLGITANTYMDQDGELLEILQEQARQIEVLMRDIRNLRRRSNTEARSIAAYADANIYPSSRVSKTAERCAVQRNRFLSLYSRNRHTDEEGDAVFDARLYYTGSRARRDVETFKSLYGVGRNIISMIRTIPFPFPAI